MITIKTSSYTLLPGERFYDRPADLPLNISTFVHTGVCDEDFWLLIQIHDTSGNRHAMKCAVVSNIHLQGADLNPKAGAATLVWIKLDTAH